LSWANHICLNGKNTIYGELSNHKKSVNHPSLFTF
jgi:hypothetical protein